MDTPRPQLALVVLETEGGIVLTHPPGGPPEAPASLPSGNVLAGETPEQAAVRLALEQTGLEISLVGELTQFLQEGTPFGTAEMFGFVARAVGGELKEGDEGPPVVYPLDGLPEIIPVRVANQRVLAAYLERNS
jgi:ADP-ribose pyrophosphatase YjhB (NUDIX family)